VDNTLLDNDRVIADQLQHLLQLPRGEFASADKASVAGRPDHER
jgi:hypothetical protein